MSRREDVLEIRWHGRGGQGTKTAVLLLAEAAIEEGRFAQGFSEYGPERMGAPVRGYDRISDRPIRLRCQIESPAVVIVLDESLMRAVNVAEGLRPGGLLLVNTTRDPEQVRADVGALPEGARVHVVDATGIAREHTGAAIPNTVMLGALVRLTGAVKLESVRDGLARKLRETYRLARPLLAGNLLALERAHAEVR